MNRNKVILSLSLFLAFACAHNGYKGKYDMTYTPIDYFKVDGRTPAQSGGSVLIKFVESLGDDGSKKTLEWVNGSGKSKLGLTRSVSKLDDLSPAQRIAVLEEFTKAGSMLRNAFSHIPEIEKSAMSYMKQTGSHVQAMKFESVKGISGAELPRVGFDASVDVALYKVKKSHPALGAEMEQFAKGLKGVSKSRAPIATYGDDLIHSDAVFTQATGVRLLNNKFCNTGSIEFSDAVMPTIAEFTTVAADDVQKLAQAGKVDETAAAGLVVRSHKKVVKGSTCLRSFHAIKALSAGEACPLLSGNIKRGLAKVADDITVHCN